MVQGGVSLHSSACGFSFVAVQFVEEIILSSLGGPDTAVKRPVDHGCMGLFLDTIPSHWSSCLSLCQHHTVLITHVVSFEMEKCDSSYFFQAPSPPNCFGYFKSLTIHVNFGICPFLQRSLLGFLIRTVD